MVCWGLKPLSSISALEYEGQVAFSNSDTNLSVLSLAPGVFVLNLVCRDSLLKDSVLAVLKEVFPLLYARRIEAEVNEILFCKLRSEGKLVTSEILESARTLERTLKKPGQAWDSSYVLSDMLKAVRIV